MNDISNMHGWRDTANKQRNRHKNESTVHTRKLSG